MRGIRDQDPLETPRHITPVQILRYTLGLGLLVHKTIPLPAPEMVPVCKEALFWFIWGGGRFGKWYLFILRNKMAPLRYRFAIPFHPSLIPKQRSSRISKSQQCTKNVPITGQLDRISSTYASMTRPSISSLIQPSVSTLPQLNQLITYRWVIVNAAHGCCFGPSIFFFSPSVDIKV